MSSSREKIRQAAMELFAEHGYAATATREICERAGVTKPVLYYHFQSKDHLYRKLIEEAHEGARQELREAARHGKTVEARLVNFLAADSNLTRRSPELVGIMLREAFAPRGGSPDIDCVQMGEDWIGMAAEIIEEGIRRGEMRGNPREVADALMGVQLLHTMRYVLTGEPALDRNLARRMVRLLLGGCGWISKER